ncbi:MAG: phosphatidylinositol-specific phospholipase C/glycerophosphodiester phosphodiesterase family protein [Gemmataceae bacterium]|nr:phosphatidylinositol-specific phospholipase C/glycerophosphodiester phosphodiesterase family protein [Gemmata sp.]MDW8198924.1 phosphatidylinositol-specific phospholipase C/glycerophosphodiester phosphodiesterase family protein [Gemmataceae bacterium]
MIRELLVLSAFLVPFLAPAAEPQPLPRAHAHNDYEHPRPLFDALACGFCSVEADIWLRQDRLLVGHTPRDLKPQRTLEKLYLEPLRQRAKANGGKIYRNGPEFYLLIDIKSDAQETYAALTKVLEQYADILTVIRDGRVQTQAVTVVISGNRDIATLRQQAVRYAMIDGRPSDLEGDAPNHLIPWISQSWRILFRWDGTGEMPAAERTKLQDLVTKAHKQGRKVRLWATPEKETVWKELLAAGVDFINTDQLPQLEKFLRANP